MCNMKNLNYASKDFYYMEIFHEWSHTAKSEPVSLVAWIPQIWGFIHSPSFLYILLKIMAGRKGLINNIF